MRIAFVTIEYPPRIIGGAGTYVYEITKRLGGLGHEVTLFIPRRPDDEEIVRGNGIRPCYVDVSPRLPLSPQFWLKLPKAIRREGPFDLVHLNSFNYFFLWRKKLAECPHVMTLHHLAFDAHTTSGWGLRESLREPGDENGPFMQFVEGSCIRAADHLLAVSEHTKARAIEHYGLAESDVTVVRNGVDKNALTSSGDGASFRMKHDIPPGPLLLFVGRLEDRRKGVDVLLKAMEHLPSDVSLLLVGKGNREGVLGLARQLGIENRVRFAGFIAEDELSSAYAAAEICIVPSRLEGFSLTAAAAMAANRPIIASNVGALPEVVRDEEQLFASEDHMDLAERVGMFLRDPEHARQKAARNGRVARSLPTWNDSAVLVDDVYRKVVNARDPKFNDLEIKDRSKTISGPQ